MGQLADAPLSEEVHPQHYETVLDWALFDTWLAKIQAADLVALDTETTSLVEMHAQVVGISVCIAPGEAAYIPLAHNAADAPTQ